MIPFALTKFSHLFSYNRVTAILLPSKAVLNLDCSCTDLKSGLSDISRDHLAYSKIFAELHGAPAEAILNIQTNLE